jgi:hypothetical protein
MEINYICPGCFYLGKTNSVQFCYKILKCNECLSKIKSSYSPKEINLFKTFSEHSKSGYRCPDCKRFIPNENKSFISCPYFDCCFTGSVSSLKKMHHPKTNETTNIIKTNLNESNFILKVIEEQQNITSYNSYNSTLIHKKLIYQAFSNLLKKFPLKMASYLLLNSRTGGFQHKIFQEYISLLEESFPYCYKKKNKIFRINSLLDPNLNLFDGISTYNSIINSNLEIKNDTKEFYLGGRKCSYIKPYYIGKLLSIINKKTGESLNHLVKEYSFSIIKMKNIEPGIEVTVTHLRVYPHYQMSAMSHINRIRKNIIEKSNCSY